MPETPLTVENVDRFFSEIEDNAANLTKWEASFIADLKDQWDRRRLMSRKQFDILERIYADRTP